MRATGSTLVLFLLVLLLLVCTGCHEPPEGEEVIERVENWLRFKDQIDCGEIRIADVSESWHRVHYVLQSDCEYAETEAQAAFSAPGYFHLPYERRPLKQWRPVKGGAGPYSDCVIHELARPTLIKAPDSTLHPIMGLERDMLFLFGFPAAIFCVALGSYLMRGALREPPVPPQKILFYRVLLGLYGAFAVFLVPEFIADPWKRLLCYSLLLVIVIACFYLARARHAVAAIAGLHVLFMLVFLHPVADEADIIDSGLSILLFISANITLPMALLMMSYGSPKPATPLNLPAGYDYSLTRRRALTPWQQLLLLAGFSIAALFVFISGPVGLMLFAITVMPIVIGGYLIIHFVTTFRRKKAPAAQRRMRISPKMQKPAQTSHHWTVNSSQYGDEEMYEQSPGKPNISYGGKRGKEDNP